MKLKLVRLANVFNPSFHRSFIIFFAIIAVGAVCFKFRVDFVCSGLVLLLIYSIIFPIFNYPKYIEFYDKRICYVSPESLPRKQGKGFTSVKVSYQVTDITKFALEQNKVEQLFGLAHLVFCGKTIINATVRQQTARAHTATHLLQSALRHVLNQDVEQRGSKVSPDSVRFDFSFGRAMTAEEKQAVEDLVNKWINADMPVTHEEMSIDDAKKRGAMALFGEKYGDTVKVITAGDVSCELCGGTHVYHTGEIIHARVNKEKSISSGVRRITMSVGSLAE